MDGQRRGDSWMASGAVSALPDAVELRREPSDGAKVQRNAGSMTHSLCRQNAYRQTDGGRLARNLVLRREFESVSAGTVEGEAEGHGDEFDVRGDVLVDKAGERLSGRGLALLVED